MSTADLDKSGNVSQIVRVNLGPTLGWRHQHVNPETLISAPGVYTLGPLAPSVILVDVAGSVSINLPPVISWSREPFDRPATSFERCIKIKDIGGHAAAFPITVVPTMDQFIDRLPSITIIQNRWCLRLYPLTDLTGWYSE